MGLLLVFFWALGSVWRSGARNGFPVIPGSADLIPDWAGANSRFGVIRELAGKELNYLVIFAAKRRFIGNSGENSRYDGNNREACPGQPGSAALGLYRASSSLTARSMKSSSSGFWVGLPARCPQIDGIGRSSARRIWVTSRSLSATVK